MLEIYSLSECRVFPWGCAAGFLRRIVPDAAPQHGLLNGMPHIQRQLSQQEELGKCDNDGSTKLANGGSNNNILSNNNNKGASLLIKRLPSIGERVL